MNKTEHKEIKYRLCRNLSSVSESARIAIGIVDGNDTFDPEEVLSEIKMTIGYLAGAFNLCTRLVEEKLDDN